MPNKFRLISLLLLFPAWLGAAGTQAIGDVVRAQMVINQVLQVVAKAREVQAVTGAAPAGPAPVSPVALTDRSGRFCLPFNVDGTLTGWANRALSAQVGAAVGAKAGEKAGSMLAGKVPLAGGLLAMGAKKKGKELGAVAAVGGADYVKSSSSLSFRTLDDMALYLHLNCSLSPDYVKGFAAALALYPDLEKTYPAAVKQAYGVR